MHFGDALKSSLLSIYNHKLRSLLTLLGIVIGVMAVVTMFSSIYAIQSLVEKNMEGMGWNYSLLITPGEPQTGMVKGKNKFLKANQSVPDPNYADYELLKNETKHRSIYGMIETTSLFRVKNKDIQVSLRATNSEYFKNKSYAIYRGRYFNAYEDINAIPVALLGYYFAEEQFGSKDPVGESIRLGKNRYKVIGVLDKDRLNSGNGMNFNNWERENDLKAVYVPLNYGASYLSSNRRMSYIYVQAKTEAEFIKLKTQCRQLLLSRHNMFQNFSFVDIGALMLTITKEMEAMMKKWNITLFAIASISLIVGGIGLFSTLLISIQERMLEIGIRKSIGASEGDIFFYFIFEALTLALCGAMMGVGLAWMALLGMQKAFSIPMVLPMEGVAIGTGFSLLIGFVSGLYPSLKAAKIDPIQAIYYFD